MANVNFHSQLASIMEVLANAAVAEICQLVDDGYAVLRLEISRTQRENLALKSKLRLMEVRSRDRFVRRSPLPQLVVSCSKKTHVAVKHPSNAKRNAAGSRLLGDRSIHLSTLSGQPEESLEFPQLVLIKEERLEEDLGDGGSNPDPGSVEVSHPLPADNNHMLNVETSTLDQYRRPNTSLSGLHRPASPASAQRPPQEPGDGGLLKTGLPGGLRGSSGQQQPLYGGAGDASLSQTASPPEGGDPSCSFSLEAGTMRSFAPEVPLLLGDGEVPLGLGRVDSLKMERGAESAWGEGGAFGLGLSLDPISVTDIEEVEALNSDLSSQAQPKASQSAHGRPGDTDPAGFHPSSYDDLFSSSASNGVQVLHRNGGQGAEPETPYLFLPGGPGGPADPSTRLRLDPERVLHCEQCGRLFHNPRDLVVHQRSHAGERLFHCPQCRKPFLHLHQLKTHQRVHTGEKPFSCSQCGRRFSQSSHIKRHMSVHTGEKRYSCSLCGKRFSQACSLKVHQSVHTGERPYSCTQCGKSFSVLGNLVRHQSVHIRK